jgi:trk system potassium uptake protein TrkA
MNFVIVGCGRVGSDLAYRLFENGHQVVVVDNDVKNFNRLHPNFRGRTTEGDALAADTLERAGIEKADGVAIVTNSDTMNAVVGHAVRVHYPNVKRIIVRNYDPAMRDMLEAFGLQVVSSTAWGAERVQELLIDPAFRAVFSAGNGEVEVYEMLIPPIWDGHILSELMNACEDCIAVALTRAGRAELPTPDSNLKAGDILTVSTTFNGVQSLQARLQNGVEA